MKTYKKYRHIGYSYPAVPGGWQPIVIEAIRLIEKEMWPQWWLPKFAKHWIHWLAKGNSVVRIKYRWAHKLRQYLTKGQLVTDIKEKYATLRIYGFFNKEINDIISVAEYECDKTCQQCGSTNGVEIVGKGWYYNLCSECTKANK